MEFVQYRSGMDDEGRRLDKVLRILFPDTPLSNFYSYIRKGLIRINDKKTKQDYHIVCGDMICVARFLNLSRRNETTAKTSESLQQQDEIPCVFCNEHILILNKPYDIPVHETGSYKGITLNQIVLKKYPGTGNSLAFTPGPLHRLDRKTTGLICFSQSIEGARQFTELLKKHEIRKTYLTIIDGRLTDDLLFSDMLSKAETSDKSAFYTMIVTDEKETAPENAKKAITKIHPVASGFYEKKAVTLAEVTIETGRTHQIRSQCASHGYPLFGDSAYGGTRYSCLFLHAWKLDIQKPNALGLPGSISSPLPARFCEFIKKYLPAVDISLYNQSLEL
ncbi:MAG: RluA family pseudouridine synthase [Treponema sp.]|nr:RluA family pseudouridine synthase [Candidatus Treponema caballi]